LGTAIDESLSRQVAAITTNRSEQGERIMSDCSFSKSRGDIRLIMALVLMTAAAIAFLGQMETRQHAANLERAEQILPAAVSVDDGYAGNVPHPL